MMPGTLVATTQGPVGAFAVNHTPFSTHQHVWSESSRITGRAQFVAYISPFVPASAANFGAPSYVTVSFASEIFTAAVCGIELAIAASCACGVPGTDTSTFALGPSGGILMKSAGSSFPGT